MPNGITYQEILSDMGDYLGYTSDSTTWTTQERAKVDRFIKQGMVRFYYPKPANATDPYHEWYFLQRNATLTTAAGTAEYDLPTDLWDLTQEILITQPSSYYNQTIVRVREFDVRDAQRRLRNRSFPQIFALQKLTYNANVRERYRVIFYPTPQAVFTLEYRYMVQPPLLSATDPNPLGGPQYSEVIREACLAVAEEREFRGDTRHQAIFERLLANAIAQDRHFDGRTFGQVGRGYTGYGNYTAARRSGLPRGVVIDGVRVI